MNVNRGNFEVSFDRLTCWMALEERGWIAEDYEGSIAEIGRCN